MRVRLILSLLGVCAAAIAGCSSSTSHVPSVVVDGHTAHFTGPLDHGINYGPQQIMFDPPTVGAEMPIDWQTAYRTCFTGHAGCAATGSATVALAVATGLPVYPRGSRPHDLFGDAFNHDLVYVITWDPAPCITGQVSARVCRVVDIVDSRSRSAAWAIEIADNQPVVTS